MLEKTEGEIKNGQSRDTGNIGYTRHRTNKCQRKPKWQSRMDNSETLATLGTQDTGQINVRENREHSRMDNPETLATLGSQYTGRRKTNRKTQHGKIKRGATQAAPQALGSICFFQCMSLRWCNNYHTLHGYRNCLVTPQRLLNLTLIPTSKS